MMILSLKSLKKSQLTWWNREEEVRFQWPHRVFLPVYVYAVDQSVLRRRLAHASEMVRLRYGYVTTMNRHLVSDMHEASNYDRMRKQAKNELAWFRVRDDTNGIVIKDACLIFVNIMHEYALDTHDLRRGTNNTGSPAGSAPQASLMMTDHLSSCAMMTLTGDGAGGPGGGGPGHGVGAGGQPFQNVPRVRPLRLAPVHHQAVSRWKHEAGEGSLRPKVLGASCP
jgi:hypothetical protein